VYYTVIMNNMAENKVKIELLAPAGSPEKMGYALHYGADAVYCGVPATSMRSRINGFDEESLAKAIKDVQAEGKKIYVTVNIYAHNYHLPTIEKHIEFLKKNKPTAVIVADPGVVALFREKAPEIPVHISTQANATNWRAVKFWHDLGAERVVLAREVTLEDIKEIHAKVPSVELEYFVHGAMCMSYSGRCILSKWMMGRSANLGDCVQPCRWGYFSTKYEQGKNVRTDCNDTKCKCGMQNEDGAKTLKVTEIQGREEIELEEDQHGTYFFNSKDLNLLRHIKDLIDAGVVSLKIEGRNKSVSYVATVTRAYRKVVDAIENGVSDKELEVILNEQQAELDKLMHRGYTQGFLLGNEPQHNMENSHQEAAYQFVGEVLKGQGKRAKAYVHNSVHIGDEVEIMNPDSIKRAKIEKIFDKDGKETESAHGGHESVYEIEFDIEGAEKYSLLRKIIKQ